MKGVIEKCFLAIDWTPRQAPANQVVSMALGKASGVAWYEWLWVEAGGRGKVVWSWRGREERVGVGGRSQTFRNCVYYV